MAQETPLSPGLNGTLSPTTFRAPQRASQYRLFPSLATPPASPVISQFKNRAAPVRRRSQSLSSDTSATRSRRRTPPSSQSTLSSSPSKNAEEIPQVALTGDLTRRDSDSTTSRKETQRDASLDSTADEENVRRRSDSAHEEPAISMKERDVGIRRDAGRTAPVKPAGFISSLQTSISTLSPVAEHFQMQAKPRIRTKPRPNLRIAIHKQTDNEDNDKPLPLPKPSPPPPRSSSKQQHLSPEARGFQGETGKQRTPDQTRQWTSTPTSDEALSREALDKPLPPLRSDSQYFPSNATTATGRPSTSDEAKSITSDVSYGGPILQAQLAQRFAASSQGLRPALPPKQVPRSPLKGLFSRVKVTQEAPPRPVSPARFTNRERGRSPGAPDSTLRRPATPDHASSSRLEANTGFQTINNDSPKAQYHAEANITESISKSSAALVAARANVAALRNSSASASTRSLSRSSCSDLGARYRGLSDPTLRRPDTSATADLIAKLKDIGEEWDALHERYTSLKTERQKLSTAIIANLRNLKSGPEYVDILLNDQLALAAVSSSMDICFVKLKSLECRKDDAISTIIQQSAPPQQLPGDKLAAMIASSMTRSRKPSTDSGIRFAQTGRSTPEPSDSCSAHRLTQPSVRTLSYGSDLDASDLRLSSQSRKHSLTLDGSRRPDADKPAPATIPEVVESPAFSRLTLKLDGLGFDVQLPSLVPPVPVPPPGHILEGNAQNAPVSVTPDVLSPTSTIGDLKLSIDCPRQQNTNGQKAAKLLGLSSSPSATADHSSKPLPMPGSGPVGTSVYSQQLASRSAQDLETQLQSFPLPNAPFATARRGTSGAASLLTHGSSADSLSEPDLPPPPPRRTVRRVPYTATKKRDPSAHTIKVYMDNDEEDILEHYYQLQR